MAEILRIIDSRQNELGNIIYMMHTIVHLLVIVMLMILKNLLIKGYFLLTSLMLSRRNT